MCDALVQDVGGELDPWAIAQGLPRASDTILLESQQRGAVHSRYSLVTTNPFLKFRAFGSRCEISPQQANSVVFGNPWQVLERLLARYELLDQMDVPFPVGGCFGYWGYGLAPFAEPALRGLKADENGLPDCQLGFYDSLVVVDHELGRTWVIASGLNPDGERSRASARRQRDNWLRRLEQIDRTRKTRFRAPPLVNREQWLEGEGTDRESFVRGVEKILRYIQRGHAYQVNLSRRIEVPSTFSPEEVYAGFRACSPAPFAMFMDAGGLQLVSHSPELFLRLSGQHAVTRPIKGTRPRSSDPVRDNVARSDLLQDRKERAELLMITDLLRNDLGRICEFGTIVVPELRCLEAHGRVHHTVATVEGRLRAETTHLGALATCFPGGSVTGAPKIRAMEIIDELEPVARGPYTGCAGYLGFNRESQLNILIRTAVVQGRHAWFNTGAGVVADSDPEAEFTETEAKAEVFRQVMTGEAALDSPGSQLAGAQTLEQR